MLARGTDSVASSETATTPGDFFYGADSSNELRLFMQKYADHLTDPEVSSRLAAIVTASRQATNPVGQLDFVNGADFLADDGRDVPPIWGTADANLWAPGESLMIVGPPGVGKSTLAHAVVWSLIGLNTPLPLGYPVQPLPADRKVLYLAMDRPRQIARAMRRLGALTSDVGDVLRERLIVWKGPLPIDLATNQDGLLRMAEQVGAGVIAVDSLKDVMPGLSEDDVAARYNLARQTALAAGVEMIELHHNRKAGATNVRPNKLDDVFGSRWLTAGTGSVLSLWGEAGDRLLDLSQLKSPAEEIRPVAVELDKDAGTIVRQEVRTELDVIREATVPITVGELAFQLYGNKPTKQDKERTRQRVKKLLATGRIRECGPSTVDSSMTYLAQDRLTGWIQ